MGGQEISDVDYPVGTDSESLSNFFAEIPEFVPAALQHTPQKDSFEFSPNAPEFVPKAFESSKNTQSPADIERFKRVPPADGFFIDGYLDEDIKKSARREVPQKLRCSNSSANAPECVPQTSESTP